jgi:hypothetical protein
MQAMTSAQPRPLATLSEKTRRGIIGVLTDIDDTLTTQGQLTAAAYGALERLSEAGKIVVPVTGRPAGWCDHIARMWPVDAVVGENGAFYMRYDTARVKLMRRFVISDASRREQRARIPALGEAIVAAVPGCALASDQHYRESDLAIDYCEDVTALPRVAVDRIVALMEAAGMTAKVSSIHVNGWFGDYDKLTTTKPLLREVHGVILDARRRSSVFVGDSPNDAPMFGYFPHAVGVANLAQFLDRVPTPPAYVTVGEAGAGFVEVVNTLLGP